MGAIEGGAGTSGKGQPYRCFLVRCRLVEGAGEGKPTVSPADAGSRAVVWRFTVEQVRPDAARRSFASIHDVAAYIDAELARCENLALEREPRPCSAQQDSNISTHSEVEP